LSASADARVNTRSLKNSGAFFNLSANPKVAPCVLCTRLSKGFSAATALVKSEKLGPIGTSVSSPIPKEVGLALKKVSLALCDCHYLLPSDCTSSLNVPSFQS
jgi:hypothetical protein